MHVGVRRHRALARIARLVHRHKQGSTHLKGLAEVVHRVRHAVLGHPMVDGDHAVRQVEHGGEALDLAGGPRLQQVCRLGVGGDKDGKANHQAREAAQGSHGLKVGRTASTRPTQGRRSALQYDAGTERESSEGSQS